MSAEPADRAVSEGIPEPIHDDERSRAIEIALPRELRRYARNATRWRVGCEVQVLRGGGETYPAMLAAIAAAERTICLETYILASDRTGGRFGAALIERARAGVIVRLIYDAIGSFGLAGAFVDELRAAGVHVIEFNPIAPWRARWGFSHRDHRKILVIDDVVAFTGGLNIADDYAAATDGGAGWHDMHCRVRGPIVLDLARLFRRTWLRIGGETYPAGAQPSRAPGVAGTSFARAIDNTARRKKPAIRRAYLHVIKHARASVLIQNAYFMPDRGLRRALVHAVQRGVDVRVIVPGHSDVQVIEWASLYVLRRLARRGIKILRWRGAMMHAKTAVVDAVWSTIGSYNFDAQSRFNNLEVTVEILDPEVGATMVAEFEGDNALCDPYDESAWLKQPWWRKALAWLAYRLRRWL
ncbi:MAG TPA: phosphatidylserine/phosphatidylglycerophosphate/cardiolipin synthase family protein [Kofleriaceae bacterium]|nr:phosphatidylserine/phosphatidylglycerophosphate/cardiolipin synthase family protein [Kofleriaceae bacterium]